MPRLRLSHKKRKSSKKKRNSKHNKYRKHRKNRRKTSKKKKNTKHKIIKGGLWFFGKKTIEEPIIWPQQYYLEWGESTNMVIRKIQKQDKFKFFVIHKKKKHKDSGSGETPVCECETLKKYTLDDFKIRILPGLLKKGQLAEFMTGLKDNLKNYESTYNKQFLNDNTEFHKFLENLKSNPEKTYTDFCNISKKETQQNSSLYQIKRNCILKYGKYTAFFEQFRCINSDCIIEGGTRHSYDLQIPIHFLYCPGPHSFTEELILACYHHEDEENYQGEEEE